MEWQEPEYLGTFSAVPGLLAGDERGGKRPWLESVLTGEAYITGSGVPHCVTVPVLEIFVGNFIS